MSRLKDITGQKFGRLTVIERAENSKDGRARWRCKCDCGKKCVVYGGDLRSGHTKSCGCWHDENSNMVRVVHGMTGSKIYKKWKDIKARCFRCQNINYKNYGGRGITMFQAWINDFPAFFDYVSKLPHFGEKGMTLDRINNNGNYEPNNLRWANATTQSRNTRWNHIIEYQGEKMTLTEAAEKSGIGVGTLWLRIKNGDTGDRLFRPVRNHK